VEDWRPAGGILFKHCIQLAHTACLLQLSVAAGGAHWQCVHTQCKCICTRKCMLGWDLITVTPRDHYLTLRCLVAGSSSQYDLCASRCQPLRGVAVRLSSVTLCSAEMASHCCRSDAIMPCMMCNRVGVICCFQIQVVHLLRCQNHWGVMTRAVHISRATCLIWSPDMI
jgi:hypothetical protein